MFHCSSAEVAALLAVTGDNQRVFVLPALRLTPDVVRQRVAQTLARLAVVAMKGHQLFSTELLPLFPLRGLKTQLPSNLEVNSFFAKRVLFSSMVFARSEAATVLAFMTPC